MSTISGMKPAALAGADVMPPLAAPALGKGQKAAREFEAQLIGTVLESLEKTFAELPGQEAMAGQDDYNYMGTEALASALAAGGGFGIAKLITEHMENSEAAHQGLSRPPVRTLSEMTKVWLTSADGTG